MLAALQEPPLVLLHANRLPASGSGSLSAVACWPLLQEASDNTENQPTYARPDLAVLVDECHLQGSMSSTDTNTNVLSWPGASHRSPCPWSQPPGLLHADKQNTNTKKQCSTNEVLGPTSNSRAAPAQECRMHVAYIEQMGALLLNLLLRHLLRFRWILHTKEIGKTCNATLCQCALGSGGGWLSFGFSTTGGQTHMLYMLKPINP